MRQFFLIPIIAISVLISGCHRAALMEKIASAKNVQSAKNYIALLRAGQYDSIEKDLNPSLRTPNIRETLVAMAGMIPPQNPLSVKIVGAQQFTQNLSGQKSTTTNITFEYHFPQQWLLVNVANRKSEGVSSIVGFRVKPIADSLEHINKFSLPGKTPLDYLVLVLAVAVPLFIVYALARCVRMRALRRKWLWIVFIMLGVGQFAVNWTTGQWLLNPLYLQVLGASAFAPPYGPWILSFSLPIGAMVFLLRKKKLVKATTVVPS